MRGWVLVAVVLLVGSSSRTLAGADETPFTLGRQGGVLVPAALNGAGPFVLLLDTGASHSSVSEELARELGAPAIARTTVQSPAGDRERLVVRIDRIALGPIALAAAPTAVPRQDLAIAGDVHGVLGQDVLAGLRYTIDYRHRRIVWHDREPEVSRSIAVLPMAFRDGLPFVDLPQNGLTLRLVADSGAGGLILFGGAGRGLPAMTPDGGLVRMSTFQGHGQARSVRIDSFRVGGTTLRDVPAILVERGSSPVDGLLPLHIFDRVTFDGPAGRLILG